MRRTRKQRRLSLPTALAVVVIGCGPRCRDRMAGRDASGGTDSGNAGLDAAYADAAYPDAGGTDGGCDCGTACPADSCFLVAEDGGDGGSCQCLV